MFHDRSLLVRCFQGFVLLVLEYCSVVQVSRSAVVTYQYTYASPHCRTSQYCRTFFLSQCPSGTILLTPHSMVWDWQVSRAEPNLFYGLSCPIPTIVFYYLFLSLLSLFWYCGAVVLWLIGCISLSLNLALPTYFSNNNYLMQCVCMYVCVICQIGNSAEISDGQLYLVTRSLIQGNFFFKHS